MSDTLLAEVQKYFKKIKTKKNRKVKIRILYLKGQFDNIIIRQKAYE